MSYELGRWSIYIHSSTILTMFSILLVNQRSMILVI